MKENNQTTDIAKTTGNSWKIGSLVIWHFLCMEKAGTGSCTLFIMFENRSNKAKVLQWFKDKGFFMTLVHVKMFSCTTEQNLSTTNCTYSKEIPHCLSQKSDTTWVRDSPIREMVGAMVRGPTNLRMRPTRPKPPTTTWVTEARIRLPWTWEKNYTDNLNSQLAIISHFFKVEV